jgi:hypothetical protein
LAKAGIPVYEVTQPDKGIRRSQGKDDTIDAAAAALAALSGQRVRIAKDRNGQVEALRVLRTTRKTAIRCRRATLQQLHNTIVAAPDAIREQFRHMTRMELIRTLAASRPPTVSGSATRTWQPSLRSGRWRAGSSSSPTRSSTSIS